MRAIEKADWFLPEMGRKGYDNLGIGTFLCAENLDCVVDLARDVHRWGLKHAFNSYSRLKNDNTTHVLTPHQIEHARRVVKELVALRKSQGNILTSEEYLLSIPSFFEEGQRPGCTAGDKFMYVDQEGYIKQCPELPPFAHISNLESAQRQPVSCGLCWYACRGEHQTTVTVKRVMELLST